MTIKDLAAPLASLPGIAALALWMIAPAKPPAVPAAVPDIHIRSKLLQVLLPDRPRVFCEKDERVVGGSCLTDAPGAKLVLMSTAGFSKSEDGLEGYACDMRAIKAEDTGRVIPVRVSASCYPAGKVLVGE